MGSKVTQIILAEIQLQFEGKNNEQFCCSMARWQLLNVHQNLSYQLIMKCTLAMISKPINERRLHCMKQEVTGEQRKIQNDKLRNWYSSPNDSSRFDKKYCNQTKGRWNGWGLCTHRGYGKYKQHFCPNISNNGLLEKPRHRWRHNITQDLEGKQNYCQGVNWIQLAQKWVRWQAFLNVIMKVQDTQLQGISWLVA